MNWVVIVFSVIIIASCAGNASEEKAEPTVKIKTQKIEAINYQKVVRGTGILASKEQMKLSFKTGGIVKKIYVDEGDVVEKGDLLAELNLTELNAIVKQANLAVDKAKRDLSRAENLYHDSVATLEQFQNAKTAFDYALSNLEMAAFNRDHSKIVAPSGGKILKKMVEENELIAQGYPVFVMASVNKDWVLRVDLADKDIVAISIGDSAFIQFDAYSQKIPAKVSEIAAAANPYTGTFEIEITLSDPLPKLLSGMIGKTEIFTSHSQKLFKVPVNALIEGNESDGYIYLLEKGIAKLKQIHVVAIADSCFLVDSGVYINDEIITEGVTFVTQHSKLEVVNKQ